MDKLIETRHPIDIIFGEKNLNKRQQNILDSIPDYGSRTIVNKRDVSMLDLSAMTAKTGDEFAMFTRQGKRLIVRGDAKQVPLYEDDVIKLKNDGYRWSGHTHPGIADIDLIASQGDKDILKQFGQKNSMIYNAAGRCELIYPKGAK